MLVAIAMADKKIIIRNIIFDCILKSISVHRAELKGLVSINIDIVHRDSNKRL